MKRLPSNVTYERAVRNCPVQLGRDTAGPIWPAEASAGASPNDLSHQHDAGATVETSDEFET
jgi:hypothetical protein